MPNGLELQSLVGGLPQEDRPLRSPGIHCVEQAIAMALLQVEQIDTRRIAVAIEGNCIHLRGDVKTWREHEAAGEAAAKITGVIRVQNDLRVAPWMF